MVTTSAQIVAAGVILFIASRAIRFERPARTFPRPLLELALASLAVLAGLALVLAALPFAGPRPADPGAAMVRQVAFAALSLLPILAAVRLRAGTAGDLGIARAGLGRSAALGLVLGGVALVLSGRLPALAAPSPPTALALLVAFASVGAAEEIAYRGYLQPRAIAAFGPARGLVGTALGFSLLHVPQRLLGGVVGADLAVDLAAVFAFGLLFGAIMRVTGNVVAGAMLHAVVDWAGGP